LASKEVIERYLREKPALKVNKHPLKRREPMAVEEIVKLKPKRKK